MPILVGREGEAMLASWVPQNTGHKEGSDGWQACAVGNIEWMVDERMVETNQVVQLNLLHTWWVPWVRASPHASCALDFNQNPS